MKIIATSIQPSSQTSGSDPIKGFPKVVAGGRIIRIDSNKPYLERMVTGGELNKGTKTSKASSSVEMAVLETITANLNAGIKFVDTQEISLAKIGGKLSEIALSLNKTKSPSASVQERVEMQSTFERAKAALFHESISAFDQSALFSNGPSKPVTVAVPTGNEWEGLSIDRADLGQPGIHSVMNGKVYGDGPGLHLDHDSIRRAFSEWRSLCTQNRMNWGMLMDRLHGISRVRQKILDGDKWKIPEFPLDPQSGPLRRPHRNN